MEKFFAVSFTNEEWIKHYSKVKQGNDRKRLLVDFHDNLSFKLQKLYNVKCWLTNIYNWFNEKTYWSGSFKCSLNQCQGKFYAFIKNEPNKNEDIIVKIDYNGLCNHENIIKKRRCTCEERTILGLEIMAKGISNVFDDNFILNYENDCKDDYFNAKNTNKNVMKTLSSKIRKEYQINDDYSIDSRAGLWLCKEICIQTKNINGYIQEISEYPFGLMLLNEIQIKIWHKIWEKNPIWHLDATGSVIKKIPGQKSPFLFSIVMHDPDNKTIIPVYDFVSTSHSSLTISKYLFSFKKYYESTVVSNVSKYPSTIVVDFSWAFINSILESFNNCTIRNYLDWSYELIVLRKQKEESFFNSFMKIKVYLCSTHFIKLICSKVDKLKVNQIKKRIFLLGFGLLQNSTSPAEFECNLLDIFNIFNQEYETEPLKILKKKLGQEKLIMI
ncbi:unnamed protein product [Brachionus calyciflorus]|uniref:MULE transposase domain-containing protein n=1 Tax=Brachionus calyciflorus TaxID=104777 RepID=A0A814CC41_9BILA|nr:unnamed protein product [Brachionus calyciflorus]